MSSLIRRIRKSITVLSSGEIKSHGHYQGRGSKLGVKNPRDPCLNPGRKKKPRVWRDKRHAPPPKPKLVPTVATPISADDRAIARRLKLARKAARRDELHRLLNHPKRVRKVLGVPARINRRTSNPHEHNRERARRPRKGVE